MLFQDQRGLSFLLSSHGVIGYMKPSQGFDWRDADEPSSFLFLIRISGITARACSSGG